MTEHERIQEKPLSPQEAAFEAIKDERRYQNQKHPESADLTVGEELLLLEQYVGQARQSWTDNPGDGYALHNIRKVAAIAVRCMEHRGVRGR